jgi:hypothetical protein
LTHLYQSYFLAFLFSPAILFVSLVYSKMLPQPHCLYEVGRENDSERQVGRDMGGIAVEYFEVSQYFPWERQEVL